MRRGTDVVRAWRPDVPDVVEVLHARFAAHTYPAHTHEHWTLLLVDAGTVLYDLERTHRDADRAVVTILPPQVAHDGRAETRLAAVRERVIDHLVPSAPTRPSG
ncbi:AraC family ligand binding domain-containing protein, partial [Lapillicoccus sp.]|uniref:AraC family ligand binding domain-containing protein n=1 Tax=Lapillicoccus sp. TaxID=1909287 RepID=UPI0025F0CD72